MEIRRKVEGGAIADLLEGNLCSVECIPEEECADEKTLIATVCKSVAACLNSRDAKVQPAAILIGVTGSGSEEKPSTITGLSFLNQPNKVEMGLLMALQRVLFCRSGGEDQSKLTQQDISALVKFECIPAAASQKSAEPHPQKGPVYVALLTVLPNWQICRNRLYECRFPDKNAKVLKAQVYERHRGSTVELRPGGIGQIERQLKAEYDKLQQDSSSDFQDPSGGNNPVLAEAIAKKYPGLLIVTDYVAEEECYYIVTSFPGSAPQFLSHSAFLLCTVKAKPANEANYMYSTLS